jgi:transcriptional regulator with XRE-family HTH domain
MLFREALGEVLREERTAQGLPMRAIVEKGYIALGYLSEIERGQKDASSETLEAVAVGLGVPARELVFRTAVRMAGLDVPDTPESLFTPRSEGWTKQYADLL